MRSTFGVTAVGFDDLIQLLSIVNRLVRRLVNETRVVKIISSSKGSKLDIWLMLGADKVEASFPDLIDLDIPEGISARNWQIALRYLYTIAFVTAGWAVIDEHEDDAHVSVKFERRRQQ